MAKRLRVFLLVCFAAAVSILFVQLCPPIQRTVTAAETTSDSAQNQLNQKLLERKQLLEDELALIQRLVEDGRSSQTKYIQAKEDVLRATIDMCHSKEERISILNEILSLYVEREKLLEIEMKAGQLGQSGMREAKLARLDVEIEILKEQLN